MALSEGPEACAVWARAGDGVRLRLVHWPNVDAKATVLLFPGRTEYCEKYGRVAADLLGQGYTVLGIDWRGQGLSDRVAEDPRVGHVSAFADYQRDVAAFNAHLGTLDLPGPRYLLAHSMGGCIGLRALLQGLAVRRAVFSAPMWGIYVAPFLEPVARILPGIAESLGQEMRTVPGTRATGSIIDTPFLINLLTADRDHYDYFIAQSEARTEFALGGPTLHWFAEAREEMQALFDAPRPDTPVATFLGTREMVVEPEAIRAMHENWLSGELHIVDGGKHEMMMETPDIRNAFFQGAFSFFETGTVAVPQLSI
ncbi:MAG: alpha/beta hydrolase [Pseudomonadota bacterium]